MPTTVTKKIGATNSPTTMDYSTLAAWFTACPANLVTSDQIWRGEGYDQGEFTSASNLLNITGKTVDSTRYIVLTCATGASFKDKSGVRTTALFYNSSNGVAIRCTGNYVHTITVAVNYTQLTGLQIQTDETSGNDFALNNSSGANVVIDSCIIRGGTGAHPASATGTLKNCLLISRNSSGYGFQQNTTSKLYGCTIVCTASSSTQGISTNSGAGVIKNSAMFGFNGFTDSSVAAGSDYNATDNSSAFTGTHNQTSLTFSSQFTSSTNDFRAASGGGLHHGTPDSTNTPNDITGTARDATTPWMGCWEYVATGGPRIWQLSPIGDNTAQIAGDIHEICTA